VTDAARPLIGITMGDPCGVGAEVIVKALADPEVRALGRFIVYGLEEVLLYAADQAEIAPYWFRKPHEEIGRVESGVVVADFDEETVFDPTGRRPTADAGRASLRFVEHAVQAARDRRIGAVVTGPIHKTSWKLARCRFPGHTEKLADQCNVKRVTMMFAADALRVALASTHVSLFELRNRFTIGLVFQPIDLLADALRQWFGIEAPRIAVAGLNPHAGENGQFGDEEARVIEPAMQMARQAGIDVEGPFPADTLFVPQHSDRYDGIVAMYHDQGLIPVKMRAFHSAVNVTLGLPIIRTSVDHGTAFDIAGSNQADPGSMKAAIRLACRLASIRDSAGVETAPAGATVGAAADSEG
jgi:4-hydroxythreonine-4-phosphate dehydrogenase